MKTIGTYLKWNRISSRRQFILCRRNIQRKLIEIHSISLKRCCIIKNQKNSQNNLGIITCFEEWPTLNILTFFWLSGIQQCPICVFSKISTLNGPQDRTKIIVPCIGFGWWRYKEKLNTVVSGYVNVYLYLTYLWDTVVGRASDNRKLNVLLMRWGSVL